MCMSFQLKRVHVLLCGRNSKGSWLLPVREQPLSLQTGYSSARTSAHSIQSRHDRGSVLCKGHRTTGKGTEEECGVVLRRIVPFSVFKTAVSYGAALGRVGCYSNSVLHSPTRLVTV